MLLHGYVTDKNKAPIADACIEVKGEDFITLFQAESDENGYYQMELPAGRYPFLTAVKDYAVNYLEYWCQNIPMQEELSLDVRFDKLEIYGLHAFFVRGGGNSLMIYFRPMSLLKFQQGERDIAPEDLTVRVIVDQKELPVVHMDRVSEVADGEAMTAYLIQADTGGAAIKWRKLEVQVWDKEGHYGAAAIFNSEI